jgi:hypothetical protein
MRHRLLSSNRLQIVVALILAAFSICAKAAISEGPIPTNALAAEQKRISDFYHAQQSVQEQILIGQKRYNARQLQRAKMIAAMNDELHMREKSVSAAPVAHSYENPAPVHASKFWLALAALSAGAGIFIYYWRRSHSISAAMPAPNVRLRVKKTPDPIAPQSTPKTV